MYTKDHPDLTLPNFMEAPIGLQRVNAVLISIGTQSSQAGWTEQTNVLNEPSHVISNNVAF